MYKNTAFEYIYGNSFRIWKQIEHLEAASNIVLHCFTSFRIVLIAVKYAIIIDLLQQRLPLAILYRIC